MLTQSCLSFLILVILIASNSGELIREDERPFLQKFREILSHPDQGLNEESWVNMAEYLEEYSDSFLANWLKYSGYDLEKSEAALKKSIEWRKKNHLENIEKFKAPQHFIENMPYYYTGFSETDRHLVFYAQFGTWDIRQMMQKSQKDVAKYFIQLMERILQKLKSQDKLIRNINGTEGAGQAHFIANMKDFSILQVTSIRVLGLVTALAGIYDKNYPHLHDYSFIINAPSYYSIIFEILKSILSARAMQNVKVFSNDQNVWMPKILEVIPQELVPKEIGGEAHLIQFK